MALRDWDIVGRVALRQVNGQTVVLTPGRFATIEAAIQDWEDRERARMDHDLKELGKLVDGAMTRIQVRYTSASRGERTLDTGEAL